MNNPQTNQDNSKISAQGGLKVLAWIILLLGFLTICVGLPLTSLGI